MSKVMELINFPEGELGEIVSVEDRTLAEKIGADIGMSVIILNKAMEYLVQIGYNQIHLKHEHLKKIMVKEAAL